MMVQRRRFMARVLPWLTFALVVLVARFAMADRPTGYKCGPGGRVLKDVGCKCPNDKLDARDAGGRAICAPKPPPAANACLAARTGKYTLRIDSAPQGATVYVGAKSCGVVGVTPWTGKLVPGPVTVMLERPSYEPVTRELTVTRKRYQSTVVPLVRTNAGMIDVRADADRNVTGATVTLDGRPGGTAPVVLKATGGRHQVEIKQAGFEPFAQAIEVVDSQTVVVMPVLKAAIVVKGKLVVDADVEGAEVWIGGTRRGTTPLVVNDLALGSYDLEVRKPGATTWKQAVVISKGQTLVRATLAASLPKAPTQGTLSVSSTPAGEVIIDGTSAGMTPFEKALPAGEYWILVKAPGHKSFEQRLRLEAGKTVTLAPQLAVTAELAVESTPTGGTVFVDGKRVGVTPMKLELELGDHVIFIERAGFQRHVARVKLTAGPPPKPITATLKR
jgi:hypothetical protein